MTEISKADRAGDLRRLFMEIRVQLFQQKLMMTQLAPPLPGQDVFKERPFPAPEINGDAETVLIQADEDAAVIQGKIKEIPGIAIHAVFVYRPEHENGPIQRKVLPHTGNVFVYLAPREPQDYALRFVVFYKLSDGKCQFSDWTEIDVAQEPEHAVSPASQPSAPSFEEPVILPPQAEPGPAVDSGGDGLTGGWFKT